MSDKNGTVASLGSIFQQMKRLLAEPGSKSRAGLKAALLLEWACDATRRDIILEPNRRIDMTCVDALMQAVARHKRGESIHRIIGYREFYGLPFHLSPETLEPRPDSETLIDLVLPFIQARISQANEFRLLDMGTGSGVLAIALLAHVSQLYAVGVDLAEGALQMAVRNAKHNGVDQRFQPLASNWFAKVTGLYDFIISNPPYIPSGQIAQLDKRVRDFDPVQALDGGDDGFYFYHQLAEKSSDFLKPAGMICIEIGQGQESAATRLFVANGFQLVKTAKDLKEITRALLFERQF